MRFGLVLVLALCGGLPGRALAHDLQHRIEEGTAVCVELFFADGNDFDFESYEVYRAGEEIPFQVGRTDSHGRVVFLPDRAGTWRIKAFSEDGHGAEFSFTTDVKGEVRGTDRPLFERYLRIIVGVSVIFGLFGLFTLLRRGGGKR